MEYSIWQLTTLAGGFWIAFIGTFHVYIAHFAVGGGLYLLLAEMAARKSGNPALLAHVKRHARFFMLVTMVAGGVTGVGIWFTIGLLSPQATSTLIKTFVYAFAAEWVFFLGEIVALLVYYYGFDKLPARDHLRVGWCYLLFAFLSLFLINGIIGFMLTPGKWAETHAFWDGFFNPSFWPQLALRSCIALALAGLFGFVTATRIEDDDARERMVRLCAGLTLVPLLGCVASGWWYIQALPQAQQEMVLLRSARIAGFLRYFLYFAGAAALGALALAMKSPRRVRFPLALLIVLTGWGLIGSFEFVREAARKPWLIHGLVYSNGMFATAEAQAAEKGYLATAKWARIREITEENRLAAGAELYQHQCASCHSVGGPMNDIKPWAATLTTRGMTGLLGALARVNPAMPPFIGNQAEREALAAYLVEQLGGRKDQGLAALNPASAEAEIPPFDPDKDAYVLLAWPGLGMNMVVESQGAFVLRAAGSDLNAQLVKRDEFPSKITDGVEIAYSVEDNAGSGVMKLLEGRDWFQATSISVSPRKQNGELNPYPLVTVEARDKASGAVLGRTRSPLPVSDEVACASCHGGGTIKGDISGETGLNILRIHDRLNRTKLAAQAKSGQPVQCVSCHADPLNGKEGRGDLLSVSAALHGFHANILKGKGADACDACHPSRADGATRFQRGLHFERGLDCTVCHGPLEDHAMSLLKREAEADGGKGKRGARKLIGQITPQLMDKKDIAPRTAWLQTPDCLACHKDYGSPDPSQAFGNWTRKADERFKSRLDEAGALSCPACHGPQHALYPANAPLHAIQPLQYQKLAAPMGAKGNCFVCHKMKKQGDAHHPGIQKTP